MIVVSREEATALKARFDELHVTMTCRQKKSKRKKYFVEESKPVLKFLETYRGNEGCKKSN